MALKYTPVQKDTPKNEWHLGVKWMSGDADHYDVVTYEFDSEEKFLKTKAFFEKIFNWSKEEHNLFCDVLSRDSKESVLATLKNYPNDLAICTKLLDELLGKHASFSDMLSENGIDPARDVTCSGNIAWPRRIDFMAYYDANGVKMDIEDDAHSA